MTGRNTPALYEDPSRLSRLVVISCAVVAALLTFLMILPPLLSLLGHKSVTPPRNEIDNPASTARTAAVASLDQLSRTGPIPAAGEIAEVGDPSAAPIADTSRPIVSSGVETPQRVPQESAAPTPATNGHSPEKPSTWAAALQSTPDPGPTLEVDASPVAQPPLPRVRPHRLAVAGIAAIPLPTPRPLIPAETTATDREAPRERFDPF